MKLQRVAAVVTLKLTVNKMVTSKKDLQAAAPAEGWKWLINSTKYHYFRDNRSLCGRYGVFSMGDVTPDNGVNADDCKCCRKKLDKEKSNVNS